MLLPNYVQSCNLIFLPRKDQRQSQSHSLPSPTLLLSHNLLPPTLHPSQISLHGPAFPSRRSQSHLPLSPRRSSASSSAAGRPGTHPSRACSGTSPPTSPGPPPPAPSSSLTHRATSATPLLVISPSRPVLHPRVSSTSVSTRRSRPRWVSVRLTTSKAEDPSRDTWDVEVRQTSLLRREVPG